jgi:hypothetical protein
MIKKAPIPLPPQPILNSPPFSWLLVYKENHLARILIGCGLLFSNSILFSRLSKEMKLEIE